MADSDLPAGLPVRVVTNAYRINPGEYPQLRGLADFVLFHADDADIAAGPTVDVTPPRHPSADPDAPRTDRRCRRRTALQNAITPPAPTYPERKNLVVLIGYTKAFGQAVRVPAPAGATRPWTTASRSAPPQ